MLHFEESGAGEPVLLIHGIALDSRMWEPQLPLLELLQGVGHISNLEAPDQVSDLLLRFL